jgi:hypothetical protein
MFQWRSDGRQTHGVSVAAPSKTAAAPRTRGSHRPFSAAAARQQDAFIGCHLALAQGCIGIRNSIRIGIYIRLRILILISASVDPRADHFLISHRRRIVDCAARRSLVQHVAAANAAHFVARVAHRTVGNVERSYQCDRSEWHCVADSIDV